MALTTDNDADDVDGWETDEETDVLVKLSGTIRDEFLKKMMADPKPKCTHVDMLSEDPLLQFGNEIFKGKYSDSVGTNMLFDVSTSNGATHMELLCTVEKQLEMKKLLIQNKRSAEGTKESEVMEVDESIGKERQAVDTSQK